MFDIALMYAIDFKANSLCFVLTHLSLAFSVWDIGTFCIPYSRRPIVMAMKLLFSHSASTVQVHKTTTDTLLSYYFVIAWTDQQDCN